MSDIFLIILIALYFINFIMYYDSFKKYKKVSTKGKTGYDAASEVLKKYDSDNYIIEQRGNFTDNYNYNKKVIKLSSLVFHDDNQYSVAMGYFIAMQGVFDKEKNVLFKLKKTLEPIYYFLITLCYIFILLLAFSSINSTYFLTLLGLCFVYQLVFLKTNIDIINRVKKEFRVDVSSIENLYLIDMAFGVLYIRVLIDKLLDLIKNR